VDGGKGVGFEGTPGDHRLTTLDALELDDATRVLGHGGETDRVETYRGTTVKMELQEKVRLEIGVSEPFVDVTVRAILTSARTGEVGDGKVFVLDVNQVHRIRTGERDELAVTPTALVES